MLWGHCLEGGEIDSKLNVIREWDIGDDCK